MGNLLDHKMTPGEPRWGTNRYNKALEELVTLLAGKAPVNHSHGAGGEVVAIGTSTDRPAVTDGFLFYETDTGLLQVLNADGSVKHTIARLSDVYTKAETDSAIAEVSNGMLTVSVEYVSSTQIKVTIGKIEINGVVYTVTVEITLTPTLTASSWHYVYASVPASGTEITATEITVSTTAPTYDAAKGGWYDGNKRCIGVFYVDSTPAIVPWRQSGGWWRFDQPVIDYSSSSPPRTPTPIALTLPSLGRLEVILNGIITGATEYGYAYLQNGDATYGISDTRDTVFGFCVFGNTDTKRGAGEGSAMTNLSQQVRIAIASPGSPTLSLATKGFAMPAGLRRTN